MTFSRQSPAYISDKQINAFVDGVETPHSVTVTKERILADENGKMAVEPGQFICQIGDKFHFLPRANVKKTFENKKGIVHPWQMFKVGDKLTVVEPHIRLTVGALTQGSTTEINISGQSDVFTFKGLQGTTPEAAAAELAMFVNNSPILCQLASAIAEATTVHLYSADGITIHTVTILGTVITPMPADGKMIAHAPVGEIAAINPQVKGEITLVADPQTPVPVGGHIGVPVNDILGYIHHSTDWSNRDSMNLAPIAAAHGTYEKALPYVDGDIKRRLALRIREKF